MDSLYFPTQNNQYLVSLHRILFNDILLLKGSGELMFLLLFYSPVEATEVTFDYFEERATLFFVLFYSGILVANDSSFELKTKKKLLHGNVIDLSATRGRAVSQVPS